MADQLHVPGGVVAGGSAEWDDCGNSFGSIHELIEWLKRHGGKGPPPPPDRWLISLTEAARGIENILYAASIEDMAVRTSLAQKGLDQAKAALNKINTGARQ